MKQPFRTFDINTTDSEGNNIVTTSLIDPSTNQLSIDPEAFARASKRITHIVELNELAQKALLAGDMETVVRVKKMALMEFAYYLTTLSNHNFSSEELDIILDNLPAFNEQAMKELNADVEFTNNKGILKKMVLDLQNKFEKIDSIAETLGKKTEEEINMMTEEEREKYLQSQYEISRKKSEQIDLLRTEFFVGNSIDTLLDLVS